MRRKSPHFINEKLFRKGKLHAYVNLHIKFQFLANASWQLVSGILFFPAPVNLYSSETNKKY